MADIKTILATKTVEDLQPIEIAVSKDGLTEEKINEVVGELRARAVHGPYFEISQATGVSEAEIEEIHNEMNNQLTNS